MAEIAFDNSYAALPDGFYSKQPPHPVSNPSLITFNGGLSKRLGVDLPDQIDKALLFSGNHVPGGADPLAQLYAGHQFGNFNPQLGDGRAVLLGEIVAPDGKRFDMQLKGAGRTPYSRNGDGRAALGPVLREYIVSEAMAALGVPTTRALAAVRSGEQVYRETALPGAVLTRIASSHIRVGTFQIFAARGDLEALRILFEYTRDRHYPDAETPIDMLSAVMARQADLVAQWLSLGFIHGVMNTDNCTLSGETIDYGPCAFMDDFHSDRVFSSIDHMGRYAYSSQADVIVWNMAQLATSLLPLMSDRDSAIEQMQSLIGTMPDMLRAAWLTHFAPKIGIADPEPEDAKLITSLLSAMQSGQADFTNTFYGLGDDTAADHFADPSAFGEWQSTWKARIASETDPETVMREANPALIPRNHRIEEAIQAALTEDDAPFHRLNAAFATPFSANDDVADLRQAPLPNERISATFCGT